MGRRMRRIDSLLYRAIAAGMTVCLLLTGCGMSEAERWQEQYDLGVQYLAELDYEQAVVVFTAAIEIEPDEASAYVGRAESYAALGAAEAANGSVSDGGTVSSAAEEYFSLALADYETARSLDDTLTELYLYEAKVYIYLQDYESAADLVKEGLELNPDDEDLQDLEEEIAALIEKEARLAIAEEYLQEALAYEEAGKRNAAIHTLYKAWEYWEDDEALYEAWLELYVPITVIKAYSNFMEICEDEIQFEYDDVGRLSMTAMTSVHPVVVNMTEHIIEEWGYGTSTTWYDYEDDDWIYEVERHSDGDSYTREELEKMGLTLEPQLPGFATSWLQDEYPPDGFRYCVYACPYSAVLNEDILYEADVNNGRGSGYGYEDFGSIGYSYWSYAEITYDDRGLVTRMDFYDADGNSTGYAVLEYAQ